MQVVLIVACACALGAVDGGLLRVPRVYNALITTHEKLVPSRAIPVSAPLLQPLALAPVPLFLGAPAPLVDAAVGARSNASESTESETTAPEASETTEAPANRTAPALAPLLPVHLPVTLYNSFGYYSPLLPYSYHTYHHAPLVFSSPFLHPLGLHYPIAGIGGKPGSDSSSEARNLPSGAKDDPEKESVSVEAN